MHKRFFFFFALVAMACKSQPPAPSQPDAGPSQPPPDPSNGYGTIEGTINVFGHQPSAPPNPASDPFCARQPPPIAPILSPHGTLANVVVSVSDWTHAPFETPAAPRTVVQQRGCGYVPRVSIAFVGTQLVIDNGDATLHNVHAFRGSSTLFNIAQPPGMGSYERTVTAPSVIRLKCDIHPWMSGYVHVFDHPYAALSSERGTFRIEKVPAGARTLTFWHEVFGTRTLTVRVEDDKLTSVIFTFSEAAN